MNSVLCAINAIEAAAETADVSGLYDYCDAAGVPGEVVECLVNMPGTCDEGRLAQAQAALAADDDGVSVAAWLASNSPEDDDEENVEDVSASDTGPVVSETGSDDDAAGDGNDDPAG